MCMSRRGNEWNYMIYLGKNRGLCFQKDRGTAGSTLLTHKLSANYSHTHTHTHTHTTSNSET